ERRRRREQHARERRADGGEERDAREGGEDAPPEASEHVAPRPKSPERGALARAFVALALLLDPPPRRERLLILRLRLSLRHQWQFPLTSTTLAQVETRASGTPSRLPAAPRVPHLAPTDQRVDKAPYDHHPRQHEHDEAEGRKEEQQRERDQAEQEAEGEGVERGCARSGSLPRRRLREFRLLSEQADRILAEILPVLGARAAHHLREAPREVLDFGVELALSFLRGVRRAPIIRQNPSPSRPRR